MSVAETASLTVEGADGELGEVDQCVNVVADQSVPHSICSYRAALFLVGLEPEPTIRSLESAAPEEKNRPFAELCSGELRSIAGETYTTTALTLSFSLAYLNPSMSSCLLVIVGAQPHVVWVRNAGTENSDRKLCQLSSVSADD